MRYLFPIFLSVLGLTSAIAAESPTTLTDEEKILKLGRSSSFLVDSAATLNIHRIVLPEYDAKFRPSREIVPNLGHTPSAVWVRFSVKNLTFSESWILQAAYPNMDNVELYIHKGSNWEVRELGQQLPFSSRKIVNRKLLFNLSLPFGKEMTFYLRYQNDAGMTIPLTLYAYQQYQTYALGEQLVFGIFFGFMLVLSLYNLILFIKVRESGYLHYFMYITSYGMFQFSLYGLAHQYLWPGGTWWVNHNVPFFLAFAFFCRILFTMSVLNSKGNTPQGHKALKGLLIALVLLTSYHGLTVLDLLPPALALSTGATLGIAALYFVAFTIAILMINIRCLGKGVPAAKTFMIAWTFMVSGLLLYALKSLGFLPSNFITENGILFGSVGEMCLLFISLGESIRAIKSEAHQKHLHQQAAIHAYQKEQIHAMRLEMELLKANIQPHFMLNSINAVTMWLREDPGTAEKLLHALAEELKQMLKIVGEKVISIGEEIRICRMHLEVMSLRHDKSFTMILEGVKTDEQIPPMIFHTLVENGITHGYSGKEKGVFVLRSKEDGEKVYFTLYNDGESGNKNTESGGLGLKYVRARLQESYGVNWQLDSHSVEGGWMVTIVIPKEVDGISPEAHPVVPAKPESLAQYT